MTEGLRGYKMVGAGEEEFEDKEKWFKNINQQKKMIKNWWGYIEAKEGAFKH